MMTVLSLPETLDLKASGPLKAAFLERRGDAVEVDAGNVRRLGGLCLQVLLAAKTAWAADGKSFSIRAPSEAFVETTRLFGAEGALLSADIHGVQS
ncbi:chemotaxis protein CheX [Caulobacter zeae]|uniref:STAS domain-containing protein n=4 Tax=Caulobacteraceae TaxID=76892 RepID=A0A2T9J209_9CAUL|nr:MULTISPECIES: STAS domain-containing protein [Caulobacter]MDG2528885.1 STAS domain-containing protein [Caulobacter endophyticus]NGM50326.1 STAS domain-containing protein [Caulobacter sp. 602-2]PLR18924.1 chemotaxis protein CheX [Caulobacter zeae]PVM74113.1 STAS domain-containing protein [Caulobacter radicis]PVM89754.1 STAS domain-containing protein [Caulobacter radicis]